VLTNWGIISVVDWRAQIFPEFTTETYGRSGFYLHGGVFKGSAGCIGIGGGIFGNEITDRVLTDIMSDTNGSVELSTIYIHLLGMKCQQKMIIIWQRVFLSIQSLLL